jgi:predicted flap endonuclease-1-like 5' DNA nuclease
VGAGLAGAADKAWDSTADTAGDAADTVGDAASSAADAAGDVAAGAVDTVSDAADATGDMVADAWDATTDAAGDAADAVGDAADDAVDGAKRLFGIDVDLTPEEVADLGDAYADLPSEAQAGIANMVNDLAHISPDQALELRQQGVTDLKSLLEMGATPAGRAALAKSLNEDPKTILTWVNFADLQRIKGIGVKYSYLLEQAGVDTVVELAARNPDNLYNKLVEVNQAGDYVDLLPSAAQVLDWCAQAKDLPRAINY